MAEGPDRAGPYSRGEIDQFLTPASATPADNHDTNQAPVGQPIMITPRTRARMDHNQEIQPAAGSPTAEAFGLSPAQYGALRNSIYQDVLNEQRGQHQNNLFMNKNELRQH